ncbi:MAG TPA: TerB family tellurite resistance protein [Gammaproteobacteria bacterium]|nr:TerB family tellurite resistance protein [Gammaproteobacteria bacterium]
MLRALTNFFDQAFGGEGDDDSGVSENDLRLATAILLVEVARADFSEDEIEIDTVTGLLESHLGTSHDEAKRLVDEAQSHADHSASLQSFTRQLHEEIGNDEKLRIVEMLWRVALADSTLDKHEDHLIRKVAGLLYVSHGDLIRVRNRVMNH